MDSIKVIVDTEDSASTVKVLREYLDKMTGSVNEVTDALLAEKGALSETRAAIKAYQQDIKSGRKLSEEQYKSLVALTQQETKQSQSVAALSQIYNAQTKTIYAAEGSYDALNATLSRMRTTYRQLSAEQRKSEFGQTLLRNIGDVDGRLKAIDASMGNYQRNVGNYASAIAGLIPIQNSFISGLSSIAQTAKLSGVALGGVGVVLGAATAAYKVFNDAMNMTQQVGDAVAVKVAGWKNVWGEFIRMIVDADFSNFFQNLARAKQVGEEVAASLDELFERNNALSIAEAEASLAQQKRLEIMRDQTKSIEERIKAGRKYIDTEKQLGASERDIAKQEYDTALKLFMNRTKLSEEETRDFIRNYDQKREVIQKYVDKMAYFDDEVKGNRSLYYNADESWERAKYLTEIRALEEKRAQYINSLDAASKKIIDTLNRYNLANDELTENLVRAWVKVDTAEAKRMQRTQRASTMVNSLTAQQGRQAQAAAAAVVKAKEGEAAGVEAAETKELQVVTDIIDRTHLANLSAAERELELLRRKYEAERALLEKHGQDTSALTERYEADRTRILTNEADKQSAARLNARIKEAEAVAKFEAGLADNSRQPTDPNNPMSNIDQQIAANNAVIESLQNKQAAQVAAWEEEWALNDLSFERYQELADMRVNLESETNRRLAALRDANAALEKKRGKEVAAFYASQASVLLSSTGSMLDALAGLYEESSEEQKKMQIAATIVNGLAGVANAISGAMSWSATYGPVLAAILGATNAATVAATTAAQIAKIKSGATDISGGNSAVTATPATGQLLDSGIFATQLGTAAELDMQAARDTKVYVLESDISDAQRAVKTQVRESSF